jgi:hypothetical protein
VSAGPADRRRFAVGGVTLELRTKRRFAAASIPSFYRSYTGGPRAGIRLDVRREPVARPDPQALVFDSEGLWRVYREPRGWLYTFRAPVGEDVVRTLAIDREWRRGRLSVGDSSYATRRAFALFYPLDELLFQHHLARHGGLVVHASAVVMEGHAVVFCGQSGAGKTTTARLWKRRHPRAVILSDDRVVVRKVRGRWCVFGTPWHGEAAYDSPRHAPIAAVLFLEHGTVSRLTPLPPSLAAAQLLARSFTPPWDGGTLAAALATGDAAATAVPCYRFRFRPDGSAVDAVRPFLISVNGVATPRPR